MKKKNEENEEREKPSSQGLEFKRILLLQGNRQRPEMPQVLSPTCVIRGLANVSSHAYFLLDPLLARMGTVLIHSDAYGDLIRLHPSNSIRYGLWEGLMQVYGLFEQLLVAAPTRATDDQLLEFHSDEYLSCIKSSLSKTRD